ncbi:MAG: M23 family metallopeptidase [Nanoarchaeota archaeon]|nr:M23 family metallopeptidase [Nanoarchaeota archaeon]
MSHKKYIIPFTEEEPLIVQGYNGPFSHFAVRHGNDYTYALDFKLPYGTPIVAARSGKVKLLLDSSSQCYTGVDIEEARGYIPNAIEIRHDDGSIAHYQHLQKGSIRAHYLQFGDYVSQGQEIGNTGKSGWIGLIPHLHFMVYNSTCDFMGKRMLQTRPIDFTNYQGLLYHEELKEMYGSDYPFLFSPAGV